MSRTKFAGFLLTAAALALSVPALAQNSVIVESRTFRVGQVQCSVGVFLANAVDLTALVLPFEFRSISGGAYLGGALSIARQPGSRLACSPMGPYPYTPCQFYSCAHEGLIYEKRYASPGGSPCSSPTTNTYESQTADIDYISPDAVVYAVVLGNLSPACDDLVSFKAGSDPLFTSAASVVVTFVANDSTGSFIIDTVCIRPANHLGFVNTATVLVAPSFTPGVVTLACQCDCQGDPIGCDGLIDVLDVVETIDRAFNNAPGDSPLDALCPTMSTDLDCDATTTVIDVVRLINVAFRQSDPAAALCDPCAH